MTGYMFRYTELRCSMVMTKMTSMPWSIVRMARYLPTR